MRYLITGVSGFIGYHLTKELRNAGIDVCGFGNSRVWCPVWDRETREQLSFYDDVDLLDVCSIHNFLAKAQPDGIFHLAAEASIVVSRKNPVRAYNANIIGTENLLRAVKRCGCDLDFVHLSSSSDVYGPPPPGDTTQVITEDAPVYPSNPYGISKLTMEMIGARYSREENVPVFVTRLFTTTGPGQYDDSALGSFSKQIAMICNGRQEPIVRTGNLQNERTFQDVRDVVRAYHAISKMEVYRDFSENIYNISGGRHILQDLLNTLIEIAPFSKEIKHETNESLVRKNDITLQVGDQSRLEARTNFKHCYDMRETLRDMVEWWLEKGYNYD